MTTTEKAPRKTISRLVFGMIHKSKLAAPEASGKDGLEQVVKAVKKAFPKSAFKDTHYYWYVSRYRKQKELGLELDAIHGTSRADKKPSKAAAKPAKKSKAAKRPAAKEVSED